MNTQDLFKNQGNNIPDDYIRSLVTMCIALLIGQIFFGIVTYIVMLQDPQPWAPQLNPVFMYLVPILMLLLTPAGIFLFNKKLEALQAQENIEKKLEAYRAAVIIRSAMLEIPSFAACVAVIETHQFYYYAALGIMIVIFTFFLPNRNKITSDLGL